VFTATYGDAARLRRRPQKKPTIEVKEPLNFDYADTPT